jgi:hypothetical protein
MVKLLLILSLFSKPKPKKVIGFGCIYLAGASYGIRETLLWHYPQFKRRHPNANDQFWRWQQSYKNKYTSRVPFATTAMVWTTDGVHLTNTLHKTLMLGGAITIGQGKRKFRYYLADFALASLSYNLGFHTIYSGVYR